MTKFGRGEDHPQSKLREHEVVELRRKWNQLQYNLTQFNEPLKGYKWRFCNYHCQRTETPVAWGTVWWAISGFDWKYLSEEGK